MKIPKHCAFKKNTGEVDAGEGKTYFELKSNQSMSIRGAATPELLRDVIATGFLDDVNYLFIDGRAKLDALPSEMAKLTKLRTAWIDSPHLSDWSGLYALPLESLTIGGQVAELPVGIGTMASLHTFKAERCKKLTTLPADFRKLGLREVSVHKGLVEALGEHAVEMPSMLIAQRGFLGIGVRTESLDLSGRSKKANHWDALTQELALERVLGWLVEEGGAEGIATLRLDAKAEITSLPSSLVTALPDLRTVVVKSEAFDDWPSLFRLSQLTKLGIEGKASGSLEGIGALRNLEHLWIKSKAIETLPGELATIGSLARIDVPPALRPQLAELEGVRQAHRLTAVLERLETWLSEHTPDYLEKLGPGLSDDTLDAKEKELGIAFPETLRALYRWRNGDPSEDGRFVFLRLFQPLEIAVSTWTMLNDMAKAGEWAVKGKQPPGMWVEAWFPICRWSNGFHLCVDLDGTYKGKRGQMVEVWLKDDDRQIVAPDLTDWLDLHVRGLEQGLIDDQYGDWDWKDLSSKLKLQGFPVRKKKTQKP